MSKPTPLFQRHGVEDQLSAMYQPVVQLKSGGYLVINPTEALVSIDINSGRSTREHNIEQTAFATNLEAANEIARQLRLRDMAGLVVIDFIDMEQNSHVRKVEKAMKEALKNDRARIQVGRISSFGLMEMSRQRLRTGVLEASTKPCPHCEGTGLMRTASSAGLSALRIIEDEAARGRGEKILLRAGREAAIYLLNKKRAELAEIEAALRRLDRSRDRRELRRRSDERRELGPAPDRSSSAVPNRRRSKRTSRRVEALLDEDVEERRDEEEEERERATGVEDDRPGRRRRRRRRGGRGRVAAKTAKLRRKRRRPTSGSRGAPRQPVEQTSRRRGRADRRPEAPPPSRPAQRGAAAEERLQRRRAGQLADGRAPDRRGAADRRGRGSGRAAARAGDGRSAEAPAGRVPRSAEPRRSKRHPRPSRAPRSGACRRGRNRPSRRASPAPRRPRTKLAEPAAAEAAGADRRQ